MNDAVRAADYASQQFDSLLPPLALTRRGFVKTSLGPASLPPCCPYPPRPRSPPTPKA